MRPPFPSISMVARATDCSPATSANPSHWRATDSCHSMDQFIELSPVGSHSPPQLLQGGPDHRGQIGLIPQPDQGLIDRPAGVDLSHAEAQQG